jgi:glycosyltransferase involved in cell wall biosynthesis
MEAMLHGIPVISSDAGGLVEAKMGTPFVAHAPAIERYAPVFDEYSLPKPVIGPVDLRPWEDALRALLTDRELYQRVSAASREAALRFTGSLDARRMPEFLQSLKPGEAVPERPSLANLSPEKRTLLLRMARSRKH